MKLITFSSLVTSERVLSSFFIITLAACFQDYSFGILVAGISATAGCEPDDMVSERDMCGGTTLGCRRNTDSTYGTD